jgi:hypothetical protein
MRQTIIAIAGCFILASLIFLGCASAKKAEKTPDADGGIGNALERDDCGDGKDNCIYVKDGYRYFGAKTFAVKKSMYRIFSVPEPNAVGAFDEKDSTLKYIKFIAGSQKPEYQIITKCTSWFGSTPDFNDGVMVYESDGRATVADIRTNTAFRAEVSGFGKNELHNIRFLDPADNLFVVVRSVKNHAAYKTWQYHLHIAKLEGEKLTNQGQVISNFNISDQKWTVSGRKLIAFDDGGTRTMRCFDGSGETAHPFAEVFNRNNDWIDKSEETGFKDFALHPELPFGIVAATRADMGTGTIFLVRWDIDDQDKQFSSVSGKLSRLASLLGKKRRFMRYAALSFSPDGEWLVLGCFTDNSYDEALLAAIPASKEHPDFLDMDNLLVLNKTALENRFAKTAWTTNPTAFVLHKGYGDNILKWNLGEARDARVIVKDGGVGGDDGGDSDNGNDGGNGDD